MVDGAPAILFVWIIEVGLNLNSREVRHPTTVASDSYGVEKLIQQFNVQHEFDKDLFAPL